MTPFPEPAEQSLAGRMLMQKLESLERAGISHLPKPRGLQPETPPPAGPAADSASGGRPAAAPGSNARTSQSMGDPGAKPLFVTEEPSQPRIAPDQRPTALAVIEREVAACTRCRELADTRTQTVFGVGDPGARLCFVGEAPGADEDRQGEPFVGRAGQLLNKIIEACTLRREQVYILNAIKCRPPENRTPLPDELANCSGFLQRQLEILRPEFICCLGAVATRALLQTEASIGKLRGRFHDYRGSRVICTYHPAYLLRNPAAKRDVWQDMQMLMREMGIDPQN